jgi:hypothetical protein
MVDGTTEFEIYERIEEVNCFLSSGIGRFPRSSTRHDIDGATVWSAGDD